MANFEVPENPEFTEDIRKLETTDPGHANIFNAVFEPIINNVLHVKKMITDHMMAKNPHGIKPADLGLENVENKPMGELSTEFTVAGTRSNIQSGQAMKTILGMLSRWYTDLKTVAWSGKYNDLTDKPTIPNGAAASCAVANNDTTTAAGSVADARIVRQHGLEIDEINRDLDSCSFERREDGAYITYTPPGGADPVVKKLGSPEFNLLSKQETDATNTAPGRLMYQIPSGISRVMILYAIASVVIPRTMSLSVTSGTYTIILEQQHGSYDGAVIHTYMCDCTVQEGSIITASVSNTSNTCSCLMQVYKML